LILGLVLLTVKCEIDWTSSYWGFGNTNLSPTEYRTSWTVGKRQPPMRRACT